MTLFIIFFNHSIEEINFNFWSFHGILNTSGLVNFARDPMRS